uniref:Uncharacterized protein n=1 Tax=Glossina palpalis gambiensis TaxID=67801 RepID=A0A1B0AVF5_9MUSC
MESSLPSMQSKPANNKCRTCTKAKVSRHSLYQHISPDRELSKTYGELLSCLLRSNLSLEEETFMPQRLCIKCANLLKDIYVFILKAEKLHGIYLNQARSLKIIIKNEDFLEELPIDLPLAPETGADIKTEPPEIIVGIGTEPQLSKCLSSFDGLTEETKQEQLTENVKKEINQNDGYILNDPNLRGDHEEDAKGSNGLEEQTQGDLYKVKKIYINIYQDSNKEIKDNRAAFQQHVTLRCELCDKIYKNSKTLAAYKFLTHMNDEEKLRCALCGFKTSRIACLKIHMTTVHGPKYPERSFKPKNERIRNFGCHLCSKKYCRKEDL